MIAPKIAARTVFTNPILLLAFGFGTGFAPYAPGTAGTLVGVALQLLVERLDWWWRVALIVGFFLVGIRICQVAASYCREHDHPGIVWDEIVGYLVTMLFAPKGWLWIALGFVLFRLFDIVKPWPIRLADREIGGGLGIMMDDLIAGLYAGISLLAVAIWLE